MEGFSGRDPLTTMREHVPDLREVTEIANAGHLVQLERAEEVNRLITGYLRHLVAHPSGIPA